MKIIKIINILLVFFVFQSTLFAQFNIKLEGITEYKMNEEEILYKISAEQKDIKTFTNQRKFIFFNKEQFIKDNIFYSQGKFNSKNLSIEFEKGYFLEGKFIMINAKGKYLKTEFNSQKIIYYKKQLELKNSVILENNTRKKKYDYILKLI